MFYGGFNREKEVEVPGASPDGFRALVRYVYMDEADITEDNFESVLRLSDKYLLHGLVAECVEWAKKNVKSSNVCRYLRVAEFYAELSQLCWQIVLDHGDDALNSDGCLGLPKEVVVKMVVSDELSADEKTVFLRMVKWAERQMEINGEQKDPASIRATLGEILYLIRFPLFDAKYFADVAAESGILTDKECVSLFMWFTARKKPALFRVDARCDLGIGKLLKEFGMQKRAECQHSRQVKRRKALESSRLSCEEHGSSEYYWTCLTCYKAPSMPAVRPDAARDQFVCIPNVGFGCTQCGQILMRNGWKRSIAITHLEAMHAWDTPLRRRFLREKTADGKYECRKCGGLVASWNVARNHLNQHSEDEHISAQKVPTWQRQGELKMREDNYRQRNVLLGEVKKHLTAAGTAVSSVHALKDKATSLGFVLFDNDATDEAVGSFSADRSYDSIEADVPRDYDIYGTCHLFDSGPGVLSSDIEQRLTHTIETLLPIPMAPPRVGSIALRPKDTFNSQSDGTSCGFFAALFAELYLLRGIDRTYVPRLDIGQYRQRIATLIAGLANGFPDYIPPPASIRQRAPSAFSATSGKKPGPQPPDKTTSVPDAKKGPNRRNPIASGCPRPLAQRQTVSRKRLSKMTPEELAARKLKRKKSTAQSSKKFRQKMKEVRVKVKMLSVHDIRQHEEKVRRLEADYSKLHDEAKNIAQNLKDKLNLLLQDGVDSGRRQSSSTGAAADDDNVNITNNGEAPSAEAGVQVLLTDLQPPLIGNDEDAELSDAFRLLPAPNVGESGLAAADEDELILGMISDMEEFGNAAVVMRSAAELLNYLKEGTERLQGSAPHLHRTEMLRTLRLFLTSQLETDLQRRFEALRLPPVFLEKEDENPAEPGLEEERENPSEPNHKESESNCDDRDTRGTTSADGRIIYRRRSLPKSGVAKEELPEPTPSQPEWTKQACDGGVERQDAKSDNATWHTDHKATESCYRRLALRDSTRYAAASYGDCILQRLSGEMTVQLLHMIVDRFDPAKYAQERTVDSVEEQWQRIRPEDLELPPLVSVLSAYEKRIYNVDEMRFIEDNVLNLWQAAVDAYFREDMECYFALVDYLGSVVHSVLVSYDYESVDILRMLFGDSQVKDAPPGQLLWNLPGSSRLSTEKRDSSKDSILLDLFRSIPALNYHTAFLQIMRMTYSDWDDFAERNAELLPRDHSHRTRIRSAYSADELAVINDLREVELADAQEGALCSKCAVLPLDEQRENARVVASTVKLFVDAVVNDKVNVAYRVLWGAKRSSLFTEKVEAALRHGKYDVYKLCQSEAMRTLLIRWAIYASVTHEPNGYTSSLLLQIVFSRLGIPPDATDITGHTLLYYCLADRDDYIDPSLRFWLLNNFSLAEHPSKMCPVATDYGVPLFSKKLMHKPSSARPQYFNEAGYLHRLNTDIHIREKVDVRFPYNFPITSRQEEFTETQRKEVIEKDVKAVLKWKADKMDGKWFATF